ncbi:nuclear matrix protein-related [Striga asiatica]|uniref:Nuclear matrix protein-related n=1 Tax=Striga asiatica TaxID=4170 RepID=A0A5A7RET1_STRAF|nr:nuclear matrix protein-related [Striga asiatica]
MAHTKNETTGSEDTRHNILKYAGRHNYSNIYATSATASKPAEKAAIPTLFNTPPFDWVAGAGAMPDGGKATDGDGEEADGGGDGGESTDAGEGEAGEVAGGGVADAVGAAEGELLGGADTVGGDPTRGGGDGAAEADGEDDGDGSGDWAREDPISKATTIRREQTLETAIGEH